MYMYIFFLVFLEKYAQWSNAYLVLEEKKRKKEKAGKKQSSVFPPVRCKDRLAYFLMLHVTGS